MLDATSPENSTQADPREQALAARWDKRIKHAYDADDARKRRDRWKKARRYAAGEVGDDDDKGLVRVNVIQSRLAIIQPSIYAKSPEIAVVPSETVTPSRFPLVRRFAQTLEIVLNRVFVLEGKLKTRGKTAVRAALTTTTGWVKLTYQKDIVEDPLIRNRINDIQDNILRIRALLDELEEGEAGDDDQEAMLAELEAQQKALEQKVEVTVAEGTVIDNVLSEDILILDDSVQSIDEYAQAGAIAHRVWMSGEQYEETFGKEPPAGVKHYRRGDVDKDAQAKGDGCDDAVFAVWEIWDRRSQTVYTKAEGAKCFARPPYSPKALGQQWYPFFPLQFQRIDGMLCPPSDVDQMIELQDEYNTTRTHFAEARKEALPGLLFDKATGVTDTELQSIKDRSINDTIGVTNTTNKPLRELFADIPVPTINPAIYDTQPILQDFELVSGAQSAAAGSVNVAKTATEAEIMASGSSTRVGERLDVIEDWLTDMATYAAQVLLQEMTPAQVQRIAGPDAVWPVMSKAELFELVDITIRAGSTAKPNKMRERDQWIQILPSIQQSVMQYSQLLGAGQTQAAEAIRNLLGETLRRFDERMSVDEFLPPPPAQTPPQSGADTSHGAGANVIPLNPGNM